jgi:DNA-binding transcriptional MerR regulator
MFTIGEFARLGRISVRMLRHYDATGLLRPAHVDPDSGYRFYTVDQLQRLNRLIALKDLGFKLDRVKTILDEQVGVEELKGMLRLRREELEAQISDDARRLARVEARLRSIEREGLMTTPDVTIKSIPSVRVAELSGTVGSWAPEDIGPEIKALFGELGRRLHAAGLEPAGMPLARYEQNGDDTVAVYADQPIGGRTGRDAAASRVHGRVRAVVRGARAVDRGQRAAQRRPVTRGHAGVPRGPRRVGHGAAGHRRRPLIQGLIRLSGTHKLCYRALKLDLPVRRDVLIATHGKPGSVVPMAPSGPAKATDHATPVGYTTELVLVERGVVGVEVQGVHQGLLGGSLR